jgi:hypothetical protein
MTPRPRISLIDVPGVFLQDWTVGAFDDPDCPLGSVPGLDERPDQSLDTGCRDAPFR